MGTGAVTVERLDRIRGCLLGGAIGDALGAPTEFMSLNAIEARYGPGGVTGFEVEYGRAGNITDDTQMTLFTAEGLLDAVAAGGDSRLAIWQAYQRWYLTQTAAYRAEEAPAEGLASRPEMWASRAPGMTCMGSIRRGVPGTPNEPVNDSKGCGGVMRVAPVGLAVADSAQAYRRGCGAAALTHGHPGGWVSAGAMAVMVNQAMAGAGLEDAVIAGRDAALADPEGSEVAGWIDAAIALADAGPVDGRRIDDFGAGWVGDEALAIAVACSWKTVDVNVAMLVAVNHSGDTDSTGSITGQLLGAVHGTTAFRPDWVEQVELRDIINDIAERLDDAYPSTTDGSGVDGELS